MQWLTAVTTLAGVFLGWWLTHSAGEHRWMREARLERYSKLLQSVDKTKSAFDDFLVGLASPHEFASDAEWHASQDALASAFSDATAELQWATAEASLFASKAVADRVTDFLEALSYLLEAFQQGEESSVPESA